MARIRSLAQGIQSIRSHDTEVDCYYHVVNGTDGSRLVHLSTFGSDDRQSKPKSSQSIQIDEAVAGQLVDLFVHTFPSLRVRAERSQDT